VHVYNGFYSFYCSTHTSPLSKITDPLTLRRNHCLIGCPQWNNLYCYFLIQITRIVKKLQKFRVISALTAQILQLPRRWKTHYFNWEFCQPKDCRKNWSLSVFYPFFSCYFLQWLMKSEDKWRSFKNYLPGPLHGFIARIYLEDHKAVRGL